MITTGFNTSACCENVPYNYETHLCCNGSIQQKEHGVKSACCGNQQYNYEELECCYWYPDNIFPLKDEKLCVFQPGRPGCITFGTPVGVYNSSEKTCCNGTIQSKLYGDSTSCCGSQQYDYLADICCDDVISNKTYGDDTGCCGSAPINFTSTRCCYPSLTTYNLQTEACCNETIINNPFGESSVCCGAVVYNWRESVCCDDHLYSIPSNSTNYYCCGKEPYDYGKSICCYGCN